MWGRVFLSCHFLETRRFAMRRATVLLTVAAAIIVAGFNCGVATAADDRPGRLHRIDVKAVHPRAYHPDIGDLVQCYVDFPIVPEQIISDLRVKIEGNSVSLVAVVSTSKPKIIGSGQVSAFLLPRQLGLSKVTITVIIPGQKPKPYELNLLVEPWQPR
jgi:hypothetical protein